jgi:hypothetical protein
VGKVVKEEVAKATELKTQEHSTATDMHPW